MRHDNMSGDAPQLGGSRESCSVVAGRVCDNAGRCFVFCQTEHCVAGAARFEGADVLLIFALEEDLCAQRFVDNKGLNDGCAHDVTANAFRRIAYRCQSDGEVSRQ
jgi:hypothetical protein